MGLFNGIPTFQPNIKLFKLNLLYHVILKNQEKNQHMVVF